MSRWLSNSLQVKFPIIQAPLAGGGDTPELVAAVSQSGGLGFIGAAYSEPENILQIGKAVRSLTDKPFGVNLFAPLPDPPPPTNVAAALESLAPFYEELKIELPTGPTPPTYTFDQQLEAALEIGAKALSFTFGELPESAVEKIKRKGLLLLGTATTVEEAQRLKRNGVDAIIAQGSEAGGHRGTFNRDFGSSMIGTISLVPQIIDAVSLPVIASGGIMDGRGIAAALALGADGVQMGTAFLTCVESGVPECYREAILSAGEDQIATITAFSGRPARGILNRFAKEMSSESKQQSILPFPLQNMLTRTMRTAAAKRGDAGLLSLWAGQGVRLARRQRAADLMAELVKEMEATFQSLQAYRES